MDTKVNFGKSNVEDTDGFVLISAHLHVADPARLSTRRPLHGGNSGVERVLRIGIARVAARHGPELRNRGRHVLWLHLAFSGVGCYREAVVVTAAGSGRLCRL